MLTDNAENLTSAISEALQRTKSAGIRVAKKGKGANGKPAKSGTKYKLHPHAHYMYTCTHMHTHTIILHAVIFCTPSCTWGKLLCLVHTELPDLKIYIS